MYLGELVFIGTGLGEPVDLTLRATAKLVVCDKIFAEEYTAMLSEKSIAEVERIAKKPLILLSRAEVENGEVILNAARHEKVAFLVAGDPMAATTHIELRLRAMNEGIKTSLIHNASILTAAASEAGLQHYKFGRTTTLPFPERGYFPTSPYDVIKHNFSLGLHTLVLLDIQVEKEKKRYMLANEGIQILLDMEKLKREDVFSRETVICVVARAGAEDCVVRAGKIAALLGEDFGPPMHTLIIPGKLHFMEEEALCRIGGLTKVSYR